MKAFLTLSNETVINLLEVYKTTRRRDDYFIFTYSNKYKFKINDIFIYDFEFLVKTLQTKFGSNKYSNNGIYRCILMSPFRRQHIVCSEIQRIKDSKTEYSYKDVIPLKEDTRNNELPIIQKRIPFTFNLISSISSKKYLIIRSEYGITYSVEIIF